MKGFLIILFLCLSFISFSQDVKPTDVVNFKNIQSPSFSYYVTDSSVWIWKGSTYGWTKLTSARDSLIFRAGLNMDVLRNRYIEYSLKDSIILKYIHSSDVIIDSSLFLGNLEKLNSDRILVSGNNNKVGYSSISDLLSQTEVNFYYEKELELDEDSIDIDFALSNYANVFINGDAIKQSQWHTLNDSIIVLNFPVCKNDFIIIKETKNMQSTDFFEVELSDGEDSGINVGFTLTNTCLVLLNGDAIPNSKWSGEGTQTISLLFTIKEFDLLTIKR